MSTQELTWEMPEQLYRELVWAQESLNFPSVADFIIQAVQRRLAEVKYESWQQEFRHVQDLVRQTGGFGLGTTKDEVIANLRTIRQQIIEEDYADLY